LRFCLLRDSFNSSAKQPQTLENKMLGLFKGKSKTVAPVKVARKALRQDLPVPNFTILTAELGDFFDFLTNDFPEVYYSWVYGEDGVEGVTLFTHVTLHGDFFEIAECSRQMGQKFITDYPLNVRG